MSLMFLLLVPLFGAVAVLFCKTARLASRVALAIGAVELLAIGNVLWAVHRSGGTLNQPLPARRRTYLLFPPEYRGRVRPRPGVLGRISALYPGRPLLVTALVLRTSVPV